MLISDVYPSGQRPLGPSMGRSRVAPAHGKEIAMPRRMITLSLVLAYVTVGGCNRQQPPQPQQQPAATPPPAQQVAPPGQGPAWLQRVAQKSPDDYTFDDFKNAFEAQARLTPAPPESVTPTPARPRRMRAEARVGRRKPLQTMGVVHRAEGLPDRTVGQREGPDRVAARGCRRLHTARADGQG